MNSQVTEDWDDGDFDFQDQGDDIQLHHQQGEEHPDPDLESDAESGSDLESQVNPILSDHLSEQDSSDLELELQLNAFDDEDGDQEDQRGGTVASQLAEGPNQRETSTDSQLDSDWDKESDSDGKDHPHSGEEEDQVDTIKLSSLAGETLKSLKLASDLSKARQSSSQSTVDQGSFTGTITQLNSRPSKSQRVDMQGGGDWDEDLEIPDSLVGLSSKRINNQDGSKESTRPRSFTSELELEISDQELELDVEGGFGEGGLSKSNRNQNRNSSTSLSEDSNQSLISGGGILRNPYGLNHSNYTSTDWTTDSPSPESKNKLSSINKSRNGGNRLSSSSDVSTSNSSIGSSRPASLAPNPSSRSEKSKNPTSSSNLKATSTEEQPPSITKWQKDSELDLENDFELSPQLLRLDLNPTIIRQRSMNTLEKERVLWNEVSASSGSLSSSPEIGNRNLKGKSSFTTNRLSTSGASTSEFDEQDQEDEKEGEEGEDLLDGLILPESVFGPPEDDELDKGKGEPVETLERDGDEADEENENENPNSIKSKSRRKTKRKFSSNSSSSATNVNAREKLQAMLDARSKGIQLAPRPSSNDLKSSLLKRNVDRRFSDDDDQDFAKGLVITDDLELSTNRLKANGLSFKFKNNPLISGATTRSAVNRTRGPSSSSSSKVGSQSGMGRNNFNSGIGSQPSTLGIGKAARNRNPIRPPASSPAGRNSPFSNQGSSNHFRKVTPTPSYLSSAAPFNPSTSPIPNQSRNQFSTPPSLPSLRVTNPSSSPSQFQQPQQHHHHLSSDSVKSSPPRAPSAYSHLPGLGPRQQQLQKDSRSLRSEKSVGNLGLLSRNQPNLFNQGPNQRAASSSKQPMRKDSADLINTSLSRSKSKTLTRKRSLPTLSVENEAGDLEIPDPSVSSGIHLNNPPSSAGMGSGNLTTLSKSKSGSTESLSQYPSKSSSPIPDNVKYKFNEQFPPSRPNTPTGPMRYAVPTISSLARRNQTLEPISTALNEQSARGMKHHLGSQKAEHGVRALRRRQKIRNYGDGHELDGFDDLPVNESLNLRSPTTNNQKSAFGAPSTSLNTPSWRINAGPLSGGNESKVAKRSGDETIKSTGLMTKPNPTSTSTSRPSFPHSKTQKPRPQSSSKSKRPTLVSYLNSNSSNSRISGIPSSSNDMRWNSSKKKWEGNENELKIFEQVLNSSSVPALISSSSTLNKSIGLGLGAGGGVSNGGGSGFVGGGKIVGDMIFDQVKMCWLAKPGKIEEPDVFESMDLEDDEGEDQVRKEQSQDPKSRFNTPTIETQAQSRAGNENQINRPRASTGASSILSNDLDSNDIEFEEGEEEEEVEKLLESKELSRDLIDEEFKKKCLEAEKRHRKELKGFLPPGALRRNSKVVGGPSSKTNDPESGNAVGDDQKDIERLIARRNKDLWFIRKSFSGYKQR